MNALRLLTRIPAYSAAKAAVSNFTQWLAVHISRNYSRNIRVNAIAPGFFLTEQNRFLLTEEKTGDLTPRGKAIIDHTPLGRFGNPEDLIGALLWLVSPWRGINRFPALVMVFDLLREREEVRKRGVNIPQVPKIREFINSGVPLEKLFSSADMVVVSAAPTEALQR